jgi:DNA-binding NarL/FixJ family response regulator
MTSQVRIVIADDHAIVRAGLRALVEAQPGFAVVAEAADGLEAWRRCRDLQPDILLLDLSMPRLDGAGAAERIVRDCPGVRILVLTMHEETSYVTRLLGLGVAGYLLKRTAPNELIHAIRALAAGGHYVDSSLAAVAWPRREHATHAVVETARSDSFTQNGAGTAMLTDGELAVLRCVARGFSNSEIAAALGVPIQEAEAHKAEGMAKLGLRGRAALVRYAAGNGWLDRDGES